MLSDAVGAGIALHGQRRLNPGNFVRALADAVRERGGKIVERAEVTSIRDLGTGVAVGTFRAICARTSPSSPPGPG